jgi:hypothetical protein
MIELIVTQTITLSPNINFGKLRPLALFDWQVIQHFASMLVISLRTTRRSKSVHVVYCKDSNGINSRIKELFRLLIVSRFVSFTASHLTIRFGPLLSH